MEEFNRAIGLVTKQAAVSVIGKVKSIDGTSCTVERENAPDLIDVRLNAVIGDFENEFVVYPKIGSQVLCVTLQTETAETAIVKFTEIDKVEIKIEGARFEMSAGKIEISNKEVNLKEWHNKLIDNLANAIILTPAGPGKLADSTKALLEKRKQENKQLLK